jgi:hypothetical protein
MFCFKDETRFVSGFCGRDSDGTAWVRLATNRTYLDGLRKYPCIGGYLLCITFAEMIRESSVAELFFDVGYILPN